MNKNKQSVPSQLPLPEVFTVAQAEAIMHAAWFHHPPCAAYFILRIWAGLRESEIRELDLHRLSSTRVIVGNSARRMVEFAPNVILMLAMLRQEGRLTPESLNPSPRVVAAVIKKLGFRRATESANSPDPQPVWTRDIVRHTAISYHFAQHRDMSLTCNWAGNSPRLVNHHYKTFVSHEDAKSVF